MIYMPWIVFIVGIASLIWQGNKAKEEYLRRKYEAPRGEAQRIALEEQLMTLLQRSESGVTRK
jgi:hypothetical protein